MIKLGQYRLFRRTEPAGKPPVFCSSEKYAKKERKVLTGRGCSGIINLVLRRKAKNKTEKYAAVAHLVERHLAKVEVASSSLVSRSTFSKITYRYAAVAHLVERHLAKVEVASSSLVSRSKEKALS